MSGARLLLIRHGEIEANRTRVWHGWTDSSLTEQGHAQARLVGAHLARTRPGITAVYSSPLARALDTADAIGRALDLEPRVERGLMEYGIGELEGVSYRALLAEHGFFERIREDPDHAPRGGESPNQVKRRVVAALQRISRAHPGEDVVAVGHGAALGLALARLLDADSRDWREYHKANCALSELLLEPEPVLLSFNQTAHLDAG